VSPKSSEKEMISPPTKEQTKVKQESVEGAKQHRRQSAEAKNSSGAASRKRNDPGNGDYQKPKQRRYRTERPFACPHCPARFTLRFVL